MSQTINSVTVLGAGTMGAQIALHCANAGIAVLLLDLTPDAAKQGLERARKLSPIRNSRRSARLVSTGGFDTHPRSDREERLEIMGSGDRAADIKQQLLARVDEQRRPGSIVSSKHFRHPIRRDGRRPVGRFRKHWLGHPLLQSAALPRLLEIIPTTENRFQRWSPAMVKFGDHVLGKGVVIARDTPKLHRQSRRLVRRGAHARGAGDAQLPIEEIDAITGPALGPPRQCDVRTMDIAGIDVLAHVMRKPG